MIMNIKNMFERFINLQSLYFLSYQSPLLKLELFILNII